MALWISRPKQIAWTVLDQQSHMEQSNVGTKTVTALQIRQLDCLYLSSDLLYRIIFEKFEALTLWISTLCISAEREEEWAAEAASWGIHQEEIMLPAIYLPNPWPPVDHGYLTTGCHWPWSGFTVHPWQGRILPHRKWDAWSHGAGATTQKSRLLGSEFFLISYPANISVHGCHPPWAKGTIQRKVRRWRSAFLVYDSGQPLRSAALFGNGLSKVS